MIKLFEQYNEFTNVKQWLDNMEIKKYVINDDLSVDVNGDVLLYKKGLSEIPVQFNRVDGFFNCANNQLTSFKNFQIYIGGYFQYKDNPLPEEIFNERPETIKAYIRNQQDYNIFHSDGTFYKDKWIMFLNDYKAGILN